MSVRLALIYLGMALAISLPGGGSSAQNAPTVAPTQNAPTLGPAQNAPTLAPGSQVPTVGGGVLTGGEADLTIDECRKLGCRADTTNDLSCPYEIIWGGVLIQRVKCICSTGSMCITENPPD
jgi:hypothetical protein